MTEFNTSKIGSLWIPFVIKDKSIVGEVVNVFRRTINISDISNKLLSITALNYSSPIYVNVNYNQIWFVNFQEYVRPYENVFFDKPFIIVGGDLKIRIELRREKIATPRVCGICKLVSNVRKRELMGFLADLYNRVSFFLDIIDKPNNILELVEKMNMETKILDILYGIKKYIIEKDSVIMQEMYSMLGLGYGVTPSTDDFFGGLLGTVNIYLSCNTLKPLILNKNLVFKKTNWVSGYLLYYNHLGLFSNILEGFIESIFKMEYKDTINYFLSLLSVGHTSGLDMALGVLAALAVILESIHRGEFIEEYFKLFFEN